MTDRELLENAAKAAGLGTLVWGEKYRLGDDEIDCSDLSYLCSNQPDEADVHWNPLTDDGDALRLAVNLRITPHIDGNLTEAEWAEQGCGGFIGEPHIDDPYAATRRAIVRAAAEIGRGVA